MLNITAFICAFVFALGLGVSGMTNPEKVLGFLRVGDAWDPSLAFVMAGAVAVYSLVYSLIGTRSRPVLDGQFHLPTAKRVDARLLLGAALFGVGWGIAGYCPGPALVSAATLQPSSLWVVLGLVSGMALFEWQSKFERGRPFFEKYFRGIRLRSLLAGKNFERVSP